MTAHFNSSRRVLPRRRPSFRDGQTSRDVHTADAKANRDPGPEALVSRHGPGVRDP